MSNTGVDMEVKETWEVEMYKNVGTIEQPIMEWVTDKRFYFATKTKSDFDLHDIPGLRKNAKLITRLNP